MKKLLFSVSFLALVPFFAFSETKGSFDFMFLNALGSSIALIFALILAVGILKKSPGTERMQEISKYIQEGAMAYLKQQYKIVGLFFYLAIYYSRFHRLDFTSVRQGQTVAFGLRPFRLYYGGIFLGTFRFYRNESRDQSKLPNGASGERIVKFRFKSRIQLRDGNGNGSSRIGIA